MDKKLDEETVAVDWTKSQGHRLSGVKFEDAEKALGAGSSGGSGGYKVGGRIEHSVDARTNGTCGDAGDKHSLGESNQRTVIGTKPELHSESDPDEEDSTFVANGTVDVAVDGICVQVRSEELDVDDAHSAPSGNKPDRDELMETLRDVAEIIEEPDADEAANNSLRFSLRYHKPDPDEASPGHSGISEPDIDEAVDLPVVYSVNSGEIVPEEAVIDEPDPDESVDLVDVNIDGTVILLVANKAQDKRGIVDSLTRSSSWSDHKIAVGRSFDPSERETEVRILTRASRDRMIIDTTPLLNVRERSPVAIGRRWISRNCLRRLLPCGKDVVVVCVVTCRVRSTCVFDMFSHSNCWVDVFGLIFKDHKTSIMVLVNTMGESVSQKTQEEVARFVRDHGLSTENIIYSDLKEGDDCVSTVIEESIRQKRSRRDKSSNNGQPATNGSHCTVMPFTISKACTPEYEAFSQKEKFERYNSLPDNEKFGPWGPERVILFGRTGSGKSTLAQMLTLGKLDKDNQVFDRHTGLRGGTKRVQAGIGRGWYVLDTPGFGEPPKPGSTIPTRQVERKIRKYVRVVEGIFSHYIYVTRSGRLDLLDETLWKFFTALFGHDIEQQFTVVVSDADERWLQENMSALQERFTGCTSFLSAEFPAIDEDDQTIEREYQLMRTESLSQLEQKLATLNRSDMVCKYGRSANVNIRIETERANLDLGMEKNERIKFLLRGASMIFACCQISERPFHELANMLRRQGEVVLIPESIRSSA